MQVGTPHQFRWLRGIVAATVVLNLADGAATLVAVYSGLAPEANPLMAGLLDVGPVAFMGVKSGLVLAGLYLLLRLRRRPAAVVALVVAFLVYYAVVVYHLSVLGILLTAS